MAISSSFPTGEEPKPERTPAPNDLMEFIDGCKARGLRGYKGDFVASDGTRVPCEFMFEREQPRRSSDE